MMKDVRPIHHMGYWVSDLAEGIERFSAELGVGPFAVHEHVTFTGFQMSERRDVVFDHSAAFAAWGPIVIELGQVHAIDAELDRLMGTAAGTVSHVSWLAPDLEAERARLESAGCEFINTAQTGPVSVLWMTGGSLFAHPIEVHLDTPFIRGMQPRLAALALAWDGAAMSIPIREALAP